MIDTDKYEKAYEEWMLMEEPMGSFQAFLFVEYQKALAEVKRLREWIEQAVDVWENCNHEDRTDWFNNFCEVMIE
jgi:hypothetical protein